MAVVISLLLRLSFFRRYIGYQVTSPQLESLEAQKSHYESYIRSRDDWEFAGLYYDEEGTVFQGLKPQRF